MLSSRNAVRCFRSFSSSPVAAAAAAADASAAAEASQQDSSSTDSSPADDGSNTSNDVDDKKKKEYVFKYKKAEDLFHRIIADMSKDDVKRVADYINNDVFGRPIRQNEFYYHGFGTAARRGGGVGSAGGTSAAADAAAVEEDNKPTTVDVKLVGYDAKSKIKVIKEVRSIGGFGLKEAKELVESAPNAVLAKGIKAEAAEEMKQKLESIGAQIEFA